MMDTDNIYDVDEQYRDSISTVDKDGKRVWLYPKKPFDGFMHKLRKIVAFVLLALLFTAPFIKVNGEPFLLFNIFERKFVIFGTVFWPQDFFIFVLGAISFIIFIVLFTVVFGRVWCGWACPQTIFMEMVFRKIEYWIEGDAVQQKKLKKAPWNTDKILKKGLKHTIFIVISLAISHLVMAYLIGVDEVKEIITQSPMNHLSGFMGLMFFTGIFYWVFSYFREQACIAVCPYGRLQGVFINQDTIAVMYDWLRGEPRGKIKKNLDQSEKGDCVDCNLCVHVCPTGIDIRNGTQLECVNCTACIDACDHVMDKVGKPRGLIRLASHDSVEKGRKKLFTTRVKAYSVVLTILVSSFLYMLLSRGQVETTLLRVPGMLYQEQEGGYISNLYNGQFINKSADSLTLKLKVLNFSDVKVRKVGGDEIVVPPNSMVEGVFFIEIPEKDLNGLKTKLDLGVFSHDEQVESLTTNFMGPAK
ncbi:cytochrome c oxidase accessory protein CcoG [Aureibacter tunicatorum]|uniref:Cytochrome c oxidase accessory protein FixG n=1 Tax=Aureibacter tunicatorum TaxID=866807 RepID=A0AAE3XJU4_9BACT|nr:cytochrome c oxidase accessory protein CcoG [Aureibacter tunicatorum]MDR6237323.1 cytochrome c oxidase accessory protein FixG [Aureibacter tunicatorum]BDD06314.1 cytochrome c oxidase accessory protein CcoG [Aureibacter tunicatorum]